MWCIYIVLCTRLKADRPSFINIHKKCIDDWYKTPNFLKLCAHKRRCCAASYTIINCIKTFKFNNFTYRIAWDKNKMKKRIFTKHLTLFDRTECIQIFFDWCGCDCSFVILDFRWYLNLICFIFLTRCFHVMNT